MTHYKGDGERGVVSHVTVTPNSPLYRHPGDDVSVSTGLVLVKFK
jgi:hypothetical protein